MDPDFEVDTEELRRHAAEAGATADRVTGAADGAPLPDPSPRWAAAGAAALAADAARQQLLHLGGDVAETAQRIRAAAGAYEEADARAATRLRLSR